jgi:hypothetical protein
VTISERDKKILLILVPLVVVLAYWFLLLGPKRDAATEAQSTLETEQAMLADAQMQATTVEAAKANFARDYAAVVALGQAIPTSVDMPSLLVQLEQAAKGTGIELDGVSMGERIATEAPSTAAAPPVPGAPDPAAAGAEPQSAPGEAASTAENAAATAQDAATPPADPAAAPTDPAAPTTAAPTTAAPAGGALESVSLQFDFGGSFFELADFFHRLKRFVFVDGEKVRVRGRLMTIDAIEYVADPETFPALTATVSATVYLTPKAEGATAGATPTGPPAATGAAPVATAESDPTSPTPTATATP